MDCSRKSHYWTIKEQDMTLPKDVTLIESGKPGPVLAIFAGVHGNEKAGVYALQELLPTLSVTKGKIYVVMANPLAIKQNVRMLTKNLNRCFYVGNDGIDQEDVRARELMRLLDECDALLDLHMFYDEVGQPFVICEDNAVSIAQRFDVGIISTNWTDVEPGGTDGYMYLQGKIGICVECGPIAKAEQYVSFAKNTIYQFLKSYDMTDEAVEYSASQKRVIRAEKTVLKSNETFVLQPNLRNFQRLKPGQLLAEKHGKQYRAGKNQCIIFPHYQARIGEEAYIIGTEITTD